MDLVNKVAIITGSAQGLGKAFAARLLEVGVKVCISDVNQEKGETALSDLKERFGEKNVCFVQCDVTKDEEFINLFDEAEKFFKVDCVDILANNAGINTNFGWRKCMEVNIMAVMNGTEIALERMKKAGKPGQIINTASLGNTYCRQGLIKSTIIDCSWVWTRSQCRDESLHCVQAWSGGSHQDHGQGGQWSHAQGHLSSLD